MFIGDKVNHFYDLPPSLLNEHFIYNSKLLIIIGLILMFLAPIYLYLLSVILFDYQVLLENLHNYFLTYFILLSSFGQILKSYSSKIFRNLFIGNSKNIMLRASEITFLVCFIIMSYSLINFYVSSIYSVRDLIISAFALEVLARFLISTRLLWLATSENKLSFYIGALLALFALELEIILIGFMFLITSYKTRKVINNPAKYDRLVSIITNYCLRSHRVYFDDILEKVRINKYVLISLIIYLLREQDVEAIITEKSCILKK